LLPKEVLQRHEAVAVDERPTGVAESKKKKKIKKRGREVGPWGIGVRLLISAWKQ